MNKLNQIILIILVHLWCGVSNSYSKNNKVYIKAAGGLVFYDKFKAKLTSSVHTNSSHVYEDRRPNNSFSGYIALGYNFNKNISTEILGRFSSLKYESFTDQFHEDKQRMKSYSLFANIYYKFLLSKRITPYITAGPAYTFNISSSMKSTDITNTPFIDTHDAPGRSLNSFTWNIGAGTMFKLNNHFLLGVGYRYMYLGKIGIKTGSLGGNSPETQQVKSHEILLEIAYNFL